MRITGRPSSIDSEDLPGGIQVFHLLNIDMPDMSSRRLTEYVSEIDKIPTSYDFMDVLEGIISIDCGDDMCYPVIDDVAEYLDHNTSAIIHFNKLLWVFDILGALPKGEVYLADISYFPGTLLGRDKGYDKVKGIIQIDGNKYDMMTRVYFIDGELVYEYHELYRIGDSNFPVLSLYRSTLILSPYTTPFFSMMNRVDRCLDDRMDVFSSIELEVL